MVSENINSVTTYLFVSSQCIVHGTPNNFYTYTVKVNVRILFEPNQLDRKEIPRKKEEKSLEKLIIKEVNNERNTS